MTVKDARDELLKTINSIDKDKLSLADLRLYAETLKIASEIQVKSYSECLSEVMGGMAGGFNSRPATISDMKGDA